MNEVTAEDCLEISHGHLNLGLTPYSTLQDAKNPRKRLFLALYPHRPKGEQEVLYCLHFNSYAVTIETVPSGRAGSYDGFAKTDEHAIYCVRELIVAWMNGQILEEIDA